MGVGHSVSEPIRDEDVPVWDAHELVPCEPCEGGGQIERDPGRGQPLVKRACRACGGTGKRLRGNPPEHEFEVTFDFCVGAFPCCALAVPAAGGRSS